MTLPAGPELNRAAARLLDTAIGSRKWWLRTGVVRALLAAGMTVRQINPYKLRQFAKASGISGKNDRLDARMIASFVAIMPTRPAQRQTPMMNSLPRWLTVRVSHDHKVATEMRPDCWRMRCCNVFPPPRRWLYRRHRPARPAPGRDRTADPALAHRFRLLTSMPGVGAVLACTLIALLPELGQMSRKQVAALVGLAPYDFVAAS